MWWPSEVTLPVVVRSAKASEAKLKGARLASNRVLLQVTQRNDSLVLHSLGKLAQLCVHLLQGSLCLLKLLS